MQGAPAPTEPSAPAATAAHELTAADANAWLDGYVPYALATGDIAGAAVFLASDRAASITGEDLNVSAGIVMY